MFQQNHNQNQTRRSFFSAVAAAVAALSGGMAWLMGTVRRKPVVKRSFSEEWRQRMMECGASRICEGVAADAKKDE